MIRKIEHTILSDLPTDIYDTFTVQKTKLQTWIIAYIAKFSTLL